LQVPLTLVPLVGGVAGLLFGALFGYVTTQRSGTAFSMISLGIVELVFACSLMFPGFFGGEGGVSGDRVFGRPFFGISFGPQIQVYYLIAFWLFVSAVAMFALAHTPLGRIANAVRDNPERAEFVGYDPQRVRFLMLMLSAFFAGISGGLAAINFEIVSAENVSAARSGAVLLFAFIGGTGIFFGPMLGAIVGVLLTVMLPEFTKAWLLYLGIFFIMMVMYAPGGMASLIVMNLRLVSKGLMPRVLPAMLRLAAPAVIALTGFVMLIEMTYRLSLDAAHGTSLNLFGWNVDATSTPAWLIAISMLLVGGAFFLRLRGAFLDVWEDAQAALERHSPGGRG
jgi:branched-chain amino acid transport system permease protein